MKVTPEIAHAIGSAIERAGGALPLSRACKVDNALLGRYARGEQAEMTDRTWEKLYPHVAQFLPKDATLLPRSLWEVAASGDAKAGKVVAVPLGDDQRQCGCYGLALCASKGFRFGDVVPENDDVEQVAVPAELSRVKRPSAFRAVDDSMVPTVSDGDLVFIDPDVDVRPGDVALVKYDDTVVCKRWQPDVSSRRILLVSDAPGIPPISLRERDVVWRHRVALVQPKCRKL